MLRRTIIGLLAGAFALIPLTAPASAAVPKPARFSLSNGLPVLLIERHDLPIVSLQLVLRIGAVADPADKSGLASLTADLLTKGTAMKSATEISSELDFVGGSLSSGSDQDRTTLQLDVLRKDFGLGLDLFAYSLIHPAFKVEEINREREQRQAGLISSLDDANRVIDMASNASTYGRDKAYGRLSGGTQASLPGITRTDVTSFYKGYYHPDNAFLIAVGDMTAGELKPSLEKAIGAWEGKSTAFTPPPAPAPISGKVVNLVDMDVTQAYIQMENIAIRRNHKDYFPISVMSYILGGSSVGRLYKDIRDSQGLAYGAYSYLTPRLYSGKFTLELQTKTPSAEKALSSLLANIEKMRKTGPTDAEMERAKDYFGGSFALRLEANSDLATQVANQEFFGLGDDYLATYVQKIKGVTKAQVHAAAKRYLDASHYALTVVAKASDLEAGLAKYGKVNRVSKESLIK